MSEWVTLRDAVGLQLRPIDRWPQKPTTDRDHSPFRAAFKNTLKLITRELRMLNARGVVLQIAIREGGFRLDGLPRADARTEHPGVILSFESVHGPLMLPCDTFRDWKDNLRAIAFHLENLRHASLYGVGRHGEQYRGWKQLGTGGEPAGNDLMSFDAAAALLDSVAARSGQVIVPRTVTGNARWFECVRRLALKHSHPDGGGNNEEFLQVKLAIEIVARHLGS